MRKAPALISNFQENFLGHTILESWMAGNVWEGIKKGRLRDCIFTTC